MERFQQLKSKYDELLRLRKLLEEIKAISKVLGKSPVANDKKRGHDESELPERPKKRQKLSEDVSEAHFSRDFVLESTDMICDSKLPDEAPVVHRKGLLPSSIGFDGSARKHDMLRAILGSSERFVEPVFTKHTSGVISDCRFGPTGHAANRALIAIEETAGDSAAFILDTGSSDRSGGAVQELTLRGHSKGVLEMCFSRDARSVYTGSADSRVHVYSLQGKLLHAFKGDAVHKLQGDGIP